jgi:GxxExxY protein
MINEQYKYSKLTGLIIGCAMEVHKQLGNGFQEVIYQRALAIEFELKSILAAREFEMPIYYKEQQIGTRRVDFLVDEKISVELKALTKLEDVHLAQAINYLEAYDLEIGLLINFGAKSLEFKRLINKKFNQQKQGNPLSKPLIKNDFENEKSKEKSKQPFNQKNHSSDK